MRVINRDTGEIISECPTGIRAFNDAGQVVRLSCNQWKCPYCSHVLAWRWSCRVRYGIDLWNLDTFHWTLTLPGEIYSSNFAFKVLKSAWDNLRKQCQRKLPYFHYASFVEIHPHRSGIAHLHVVTMHWCPGRIKDFAHHAGFGYEATETTISGMRAALYVAKYTSKQGQGMPRRFRRVRLSQSWPKLPKTVPEMRVFPPLPRESIWDYLVRVSMETDIAPNVLRERWMDYTQDYNLSSEEGDD